MWARGDYTQVGERLLPMGAALLDACERAVGGLTATRLVDAACGVGNVALQAAARGATVTGVDLTPELLALAADRADRTGHQIDWVAGDLADPATADRATSRGPADVVASCAGHAFVPDTAACTAAIAQMLRSGGLFAYTAWGRWPDDPFGRPLAPYVSVCSPDRMPFAWADEQVFEAGPLLRRRPGRAPAPRLGVRVGAGCGGLGPARVAAARGRRGGADARRAGRPAGSLRRCLHRAPRR